MVCDWVKAAGLLVSYVGAHPVRDGFQGVCHAYRPRGGLLQKTAIAQPFKPSSTFTVFTPKSSAA